MLDSVTLSPRLQVFPLHSTVTLEEQNNVFLSPVPGYRKVGSLGLPRGMLTALPHASLVMLLAPDPLKLLCLRSGTLSLHCSLFFLSTCCVACAWCPGHQGPWEWFPQESRWHYIEVSRVKCLHVELDDLDLCHLYLYDFKQITALQLSFIIESWINNIYLTELLERLIVIIMSVRKL